MFDFFRNRSERKRAELRDGHRMVMARQLAGAGIREDQFSKVVGELSYWPERGATLQALAVNSAIAKYACSTINKPHTVEENIVHLVLQAVTESIVCGGSISRGDLCGAVRDMIDAAAEDKERTSNLLTPKYDECNGFANKVKLPDTESAQQSLLNPENLAAIRNGWCDNIEFDLYMTLCCDALARGEQVSIHMVESLQTGHKRISTIYTRTENIWTEPALLEQMERDQAAVRIIESEEHMRPSQLVRQVANRIQISEKGIAHKLEQILDRLGVKAPEIKVNELAIHDPDAILKHLRGDKE